MCPQCQSLKWSTIEATGHGTVISYVIPRHPPIPFFEDGYIVAQPGGRTSTPRVWAAGDVTRPLLPSVAVAAGSAATAVAEIRKRSR